MQHAAISVAAAINPTRLERITSTSLPHLALSAADVASDGSNLHVAEGDDHVVRLTGIIDPDRSLSAAITAPPPG